jgi:hypothetical protein
MLQDIKSEALSRIRTTQAIWREIDAASKSVPILSAADRSKKGMLFVYNYGVYEFVVTHSVSELINVANRISIPLKKARTELLALGLDPEFNSFIDGSLKKTWIARSSIIRRIRSSDPLLISEDLFPHDGSHYRPEQLETIWYLFGINGPIVSYPRHRQRIIEMVGHRNAIAHGRESPESIGSRFSPSELWDRIEDTERICSHILSSIEKFVTLKRAFR